MVLSQGADAVYLFNYFLQGHLADQWSPEVFKRTLAAMASLERVSALPRRHAITYRDVLAPGEPRETWLPAEGRDLAFRLATGPKPGGRPVEVLIELAAVPSQPPVVRVNATVCGPSTQPSEKVLVFAVPADAMVDQETVVEVAAPGGAVKVVRVEVAVL